MKPQRRYRLVLAVLFGAVAPLLLQAEFFWRLPGTSEAQLKQLGGARLYATDVEVNGAPGNLAVYAFESAPDAVGRQLARTLNLPLPRRGGEAAWLTSAVGNTLQRMLVLPSPASPDACMVLAFDQRTHHAEQARGKTPAWPPGVPVLSAKPLFTAECKRTRTTLVTADSTATPASLLQEATALLHSAGWSEMAPATGSLRMFTSDQRQCVLYASRNAQTGATIITLLQRDGATP